MSLHPDNCIPRRSCLMVYALRGLRRHKKTGTLSSVHLKHLKGVAEIEQQCCSSCSSFGKFSVPVLSVRSVSGQCRGKIDRCSSDAASHCASQDLQLPQNLSDQVNVWFQAFRDDMQSRFRRKLIAGLW